MCNVEKRIIMKALRYLLIVIAMVSFLSVRAQGLAMQPRAEMQSTSVMVGSGSTLPQAAISGTSTTYTTTTTGAYGPRRAKKDDDNPFGDETIGGTTNPMEPATPIGDAALPLFLLALAFAICKVRKRARV